MSAFEMVSSVLALVAIVVSIVSYRKADFVAKQMLEVSKGTFELDKGAIEIDVNKLISEAQARVSDIAIQMLPLTSKSERSFEEQRHLEGMEVAFKSAMENSVNAYEEACAKYLDNKIDRMRFMKTYKRAIRQLVEDPNHRQYFDALTSPYKAILKVYGEWENLEK